MDRNFDMEDITDEIVDMFFAQKASYEKANGTYVDPREKLFELLQDVVSGNLDYGICDKQYGDYCNNPRCAKTILSFKNNKSVYFKCGREEIVDDKTH